jgi:glycosyltransferase involved in cell wall biosynthesis
VNLCLVGTGPFKHKILQWLEEEKISHVTEVIEWMPRNQLDKIYQSSSVFLFPSHEGAGMVVPEAMSFHLPVVCLKNCGPGEFLHPLSDLAVKATTYEETISNLAQRLSRLSYNPADMVKESAFSAQRFNNLFQWDVRGEMLRNIYAAISVDKKENITSELNKIEHAKAKDYSRSSSE